MSYTPINWQNGDTITAEKMNKMDNGWSVEPSQLFSETVTTSAGEYGNEGALSYGSVVSAGEIVVTFGGTDYTCTAIDMTNGVYGYGGVDSNWNYDFTDFPFALVFSATDGNILATETAGTYSISATALTIETSTEFRDAVGSFVTSPMMCVVGTTTYAEMNEARTANRLMFIYYGDLAYFVSAFSMSTGPEVVKTAPATGEGGNFGFNENFVLTFYNN